MSETQLLQSMTECADEIEACGAGNEAAVVRKAKAEILKLTKQLEEARATIEECEILSASLDSALCHFLNSASDPYRSGEKDRPYVLWETEVREAMSRLSSSYSDWRRARSLLHGSAK